MKSKHALITSLVLVPVAALLRILQYIFIIDDKGYFSVSSLFDTVLSWSLYAVYALTAVMAVILLISGSKTDSGYTRAVNSSAFRVISFVMAALILFDCGIRTGRMASSMTPYTDWVAVLGIPTAIFFISQVIRVKQSVISAISGIFPAIYICSRGVVEFFASFEKSHISESKLELLTVCAIAMFTVSLCVMHVGVKVSEKRIAATALLVSAIVPATSVSRIVAIITNKYTGASDITDIVWAAIQFIFIIISILVLTRLTLVKAPEPENEEESEPSDDEDPLDIYITDIPEETEEPSND